MSTVLEMIDVLEGQYLDKSAYLEEMVYPNPLEHIRFTGPGATDADKRVSDKLASIMFDHGAKNGTLHFLPLDQLLEHPGGNGIGVGLNDKYFDPVAMLTLAQDHDMNGVAIHPGWARTHKAMGLTVPMILKISGSTNYGLNASGGRAQSDLLASNVAETAEYYGASAIGYTYYMGSPSQAFVHRDYRQVVEGARRAGLPLIVWAYPRGPEMTKVGLNSPTTVLGAVTAASSIGGDVLKINIPQPMTDEQYDYTKTTYGKVLGGALAWSAPLMKAGNVLEVLKRIVHIATLNGVGIITSGGSKANAQDVVGRVELAMNAGAMGIINGRNVSTTMDDVTGAESNNQLSQHDVIKESRRVLAAYSRRDPRQKDGE